MHTNEMDTYVRPKAAPEIWLANAGGAVYVQVTGQRRQISWNIPGGAGIELG
jgi:hypothetical protein